MTAADPAPRLLTPSVSGILQGRSPFGLPSQIDNAEGEKRNGDTQLFSRPSPGNPICVETLTGLIGLPCMHAAANWTDVKRWLMETTWPELQKVEPVLVDAAALEDGWIEELAYQERNYRAKVDTAALRIANRGACPPRDPLPRCYLTLRVEYARGLSVALSAAEETGHLSNLFILPPLIHSLTAKLRWSLIDAWHSLGQFQWEALAYCLADWQTAATNQLKNPSGE